MSAENDQAAPNCELYALELRTMKWKALVQWYRTALGLRCLVRVDEGEYALLAAGAARLSIVGRREVEPASTRQLLIFEVEDLEVANERLQDAGSDPTPPEEHGEGFWQTTVCDPDGNRLRLFQWPKK